MNEVSVGLEIDDIDLIESDQCHEQPHICFCKPVSSEISFLTKDVLYSIERSKE